MRVFTVVLSVFFAGNAPSSGISTASSTNSTAEESTGKFTCKTISMFKIGERVVCN